MDIRLTSMVFRIAVGFGSIVCFSDCIAVSVVYDQDYAEFTCVINPYTLTQRWLVDSTVVSDCGVVSCVETASNPAHYSFTSTTATGVFIFKIDPIMSSDEGKTIKCFDGTNTEEKTISTDLNPTTVPISGPWNNSTHSQTNSYSKTPVATFFSSKSYTNMTPSTVGSVTKSTDDVNNRPKSTKTITIISITFVTVLGIVLIVLSIYIYCLSRCR